MADPSWRGDEARRDPVREYIRQRCPAGTGGFVAEDLDLVARTFGPNYGLDAGGRLALIEVKFGSAPLGQSKARTFGLIDALLRAGDPGGRYRGFYVLRHRIDDEWSDDDEVMVNACRMKVRDFAAWIQGLGPEIEPRRFK